MVDCPWHGKERQRTFPLRIRCFAWRVHFAVDTKFARLTTCAWPNGLRCYYHQATSVPVTLPPERVD
eukprot:2428310-Pyramimonas_sp.AAC.1